MGPKHECTLHTRAHSTQQNTVNDHMKLPLDLRGKKDVTAGCGEQARGLCERFRRLSKGVENG